LDVRHTPARPTFSSLKHLLRARLSACACACAVSASAFAFHLLATQLQRRHLQVIHYRGIQRLHRHKVHKVHIKPQLARKRCLASTYMVGINVITSQMDLELLMGNCLLIGICFFLIFWHKCSINKKTLYCSPKPLIIIRKSTMKHLLKLYPILFGLLILACNSSSDDSNPSTDVS